MMVCNPIVVPVLRATQVLSARTFWICVAAPPVKMVGAVCSRVLLYPVIALEAGLAATVTSQMFLVKWWQGTEVWPKNKCVIMEAVVWMLAILTTVFARRATLAATVRVKSITASTACVGMGAPAAVLLEVMPVSVH